MENGSYVKGQNVNTPKGPGHIVDTVGDEVTVKLESGSTVTIKYDDLRDDSSAG